MILKDVITKKLPVIPRQDMILLQDEFNEPIYSFCYDPEWTKEMIINDFKNNEDVKRNLKSKVTDIRGSVDHPGEKGERRITTISIVKEKVVS